MAGANGYKKTPTHGPIFYDIEVDLKIAGVIVSVENDVIHVRSQNPDAMLQIGGVFRQAREEAEALAKMKTAE